MGASKKYTITKQSLNHQGHILHRIKALKSFNGVKVGDLGGWVESKDNLSQDGYCWVFDNAKVYDNARIKDNANIFHESQVYGNAVVMDNAQVCNSAIVCDDANIAEYAGAYNTSKVHGNATIKGSARIVEHASIMGHATVSDYGCVGCCAKVSQYAMILDNAQVCGESMVDGCARVEGFAEVTDNAHISGDAKLCDSAKVFGYAVVTGNARVQDYAHVFGYARLIENAIVCQDMWVHTQIVIHEDLSDRKNIQKNLMAQCGLLAFGGKVTCYKVVSSDLSSFHDPWFEYEVGEWAEAENPEISNVSCAPGLHFGPLTYWSRGYNKILVTYLIAEVNLEDIITIQEGKIRCKKAYIKGSETIEI